MASEDTQTKSKAREYRDRSCVLRSLCHQETSEVVRHYTSGLGTVAERGVVRTDL